MERTFTERTALDTHIDNTLPTGGNPKINAEGHRNLLKTILNSGRSVLGIKGIIDGEGSPPADTADTVTGVNGEFYFDTINKVLYGPKTDAGWGTGAVLDVSNWAKVGNTNIIPMDKIPNIPASKLPNSANRSDEDIQGLARGQITDANIPSDITRDDEVENFAKVNNSAIIPVEKIHDDITRDNEVEDFAKVENSADLPVNKLPIRLDIFGEPIYEENWNITSQYFFQYQNGSAPGSNEFIIEANKQYFFTAIDIGVNSRAYTSQIIPSNDILNLQASTYLSTPSNSTAIGFSGSDGSRNFAHYFVSKDANNRLLFTSSHVTIDPMPLRVYEVGIKTS